MTISSTESAYFVERAPSQADGSFDHFSVSREDAVPGFAMEGGGEQYEALPEGQKVYIDEVAVRPVTTKSGVSYNVLDTAKGTASSGCTAKQILSHMLLAPEGVQFQMMMQSEWANGQVKVNKSIETKGAETRVKTKERGKIAVYTESVVAPSTDFTRKIEINNEKLKGYRPKPADINNPPKFKFLASIMPRTGGGGGFFDKVRSSVPGFRNDDVSEEVDLGMKMQEGEHAFGRFFWGTPSHLKNDP